MPQAAALPPICDSKPLSRTASFHVAAVPELEHQKHPEQVAKIGSIVAFQAGEELFDQCPAEVTALIGAGIQQHITSHLPELRNRLQPQPDRHTEAVFFLFQNGFRQQIACGALEQIALLQAPNLQAGRQMARKFGQMMIEIGKANADAGQLGGTDHLGQVLVPQGHLYVHIQQAVQFRFGGSSLVMSPNDAQKIAMSVAVAIQLRSENILRREFLQQPPLAVAFWIACVRRPNVLLSLAEQRQRGGGGEHNRFQGPPHNTRNVLVQKKYLLGAIAFVTAKQLIAAVSGQQDCHAMLAREFGAPVGGDGGGIRKRLVISFDELGDHLVGFLRTHDHVGVAGMEVLGGEMSIVKLVPALFGKPNAKGVCGLLFNLAQKTCYGAAVSAAAQETTGTVPIKVSTGGTDRVLHALKQFIG